MAKRTETYISRHPDIDGGWAWVVLVSSFSILLLVCGALYSVSVFNVIFLEEFRGASKTATSLVGALLIGLIAFMGPVSSTMSNRFGWRTTIFLGGVIATLGTVMSAFAQTMKQLIFTYGFISGIGHGLCYTPAIVAVGYYFERHRTLASGIASIGAGLGMTIFPPLIRSLHSQFTWQELFVYMGCLYAQICVLGALLRPLPKRLEDDVISDVIDEVIEYKPVPTSAVQCSTTQCTQNGMNTEYTAEISSQIANQNCIDEELTTEKQAFTKTFETRQGFSEDGFSEDENRKNQIEHYQMPKQLPTETSDVYEYSSASDISQCTCSKIGLYFGTCCTYSCKCVKPIHKESEMKFKLSQAGKTTRNFACFCTSIFLFGIGLSGLYLHLSAFALAHGASQSEASYLVTITGLASICSRVITGIAGNDPGIDNSILYIGSFSVAGLSTLLCPLYAYSNAGRIVYSVLFGFYGSCFNVLLASLTVEIIGLQKLSTAFGIEMAICGISYFVGPILAGALFDFTQSYDQSFYFAGSCLVLSALVMLSVSKDINTTQSDDVGIHATDVISSINDVTNPDSKDMHGRVI